MLDKEPAKDPEDTETTGRVSLGVWEEISGRLQRIQAEDHTLTVVLTTGSLVIDMDSIESRTARQLQSEVGAEVSILRTDDPRTPFRVRVER